MYSLSKEGAPEWSSQVEWEEKGRKTDTFTCHSVSYFLGQPSVFSYNIPGFQGGCRKFPHASSFAEESTGLGADPGSRLTVGRGARPTVGLLCPLGVTMATGPRLRPGPSQHLGLPTGSRRMFCVYSPPPGKRLREWTHYMIISLCLVPRTVPFPNSSHLTFIGNNVRENPLHSKAVQWDHKHWNHKARYLILLHFRQLNWV